MTQLARLHAHLERHGSVTAREAFIMLGIQQLSARVSELEKLGFSIVREPEKVPTRDGRTNIVRYVWKRAA